MTAAPEGIGVSSQKQRAMSSCSTGYDEDVHDPAGNGTHLTRPGRRTGRDLQVRGSQARTPLLNASQTEGVNGRQRQALKHGVVAGPGHRRACNRCSSDRHQRLRQDIPRRSARRHSRTDAAPTAPAPPARTPARFVRRSTCPSRSRGSRMSPVYTDGTLATTGCMTRATIIVAVPRAAQLWAVNLRPAGCRRP